jgi:dipicolinate synthase subunit A
MRKLVVVPGDARDREVARIAEASGWLVTLWESGTHSASVDASQLEGAWLLAPISGIDAEGCMHAEAGLVTLPRRWYVSLAGGRIMAGLVDPAVRDQAEGHGIHVISYRESERFLWQNAVVTAEGAVAYAVRATGYGLFQRPVAVLGFGRVGRLLAQRLRALGAQVRVLDREADHRAQAQAEGLSALPLLPEGLGSIEILFNTIPYPVITREWERLLMDVCVFELASTPGGVAPEVDCAKLSLVRLPGLPGKIAPKRAAEIVWETVMAD